MKCSKPQVPGCLATSGQTLQSAGQHDFLAILTHNPLRSAKYVTHCDAQIYIKLREMIDRVTSQSIAMTCDSFFKCKYFISFATPMYNSGVNLLLLQKLSE